MISVISPAKTLDFESQNGNVDFTLPRLTTQSNKLIRALRKKKSEDIQNLMGVSENIAKLNVQRYKNYQIEHTIENAKTSINAFKGDVYLGLDVDQLSNEDITYTQNHLRILSGLYGLLRPLDLMQAHRLEMGTKLEVGEYNSLYSFWGDQIVKLLLKDLKNQGDNALLNLTSNEYFKSIKRKALKARVINVDFLNAKNGNYKVISFFAKKARGMMARYVIQNQINDPELLIGFDSDGYYYDSLNSTQDNLIFKREEK